MQELVGKEDGVLIAHVPQVDLHEVAQTRDHLFLADLGRRRGGRGLLRTEALTHFLLRIQYFKLIVVSCACFRFWLVRMITTLRYKALASPTKEASFLALRLALSVDVCFLVLRSKDEVKARET